MIRTAFAVLFVVATAASAHANTAQTQQQTQAPRQTVFTIVECSGEIAAQATCDVREVSRGHADLAPRFIVPANNDRVVTA